MQALEVGAPVLGLLGVAEDARRGPLEERPQDGRGEGGGKGIEVGHGIR